MAGFSHCLFTAVPLATASWLRNLDESGRVGRDFCPRCRNMRGHDVSVPTLLGYLFVRNNQIFGASKRTLRSLIIVLNSFLTIAGSFWPSTFSPSL